MKSNVESGPPLCLLCVHVNHDGTRLARCAVCGWLQGHSSRKSHTVFHTGGRGHIHRSPGSSVGAYPEPVFQLPSVTYGRVPSALGVVPSTCWLIMINFRHHRNQSCPSGYKGDLAIWISVCLIYEDAQYPRMCILIYAPHTHQYHAPRDICIRVCCIYDIHVRGCCICIFINKASRLELRVACCVLRVIYVYVIKIIYLYHA